ncbi:YidB family protein [Enterobacter hormaechei]|uniref:YidB family protein n=1 Tax=Enterobacter hormaechei TaxID=158836 RepID=UPI0032DA7574
MMNLFDSITNLFNKDNGDSYQLQAVISWLENQGGITGLMDKFRNEGLGALVESWISSEDNLPVSADQITTVLGFPAVQELASKLGVNPGSASSLLAEVLPGIVSSMTDGKGNALSEILSAGMKFLKK